MFFQISIKFCTKKLFLKNGTTHHSGLINPQKAGPEMKKKHTYSISGSVGSNFFQFSEENAFISFPIFNPKNVALLARMKLECPSSFVIVLFEIINIISNKKNLRSQSEVIRSKTYILPLMTRISSVERTTNNSMIETNKQSPF